MSKLVCPLGDGCDLTIAWMKGAEDARDRERVRITVLTEYLEAARLDAKEAEAKLEMAVFLLTEAMVSLTEGKAKQRRNRADIIDQVLKEWRTE